MQGAVDVLRLYNESIPIVDIQTAGISLIPQLDKSAVVIGRFADPENDRSHHGARLSVGELQVRPAVNLGAAWDSALILTGDACELVQMMHLSPQNVFNKYLGYPFDPVAEPDRMDPELNPLARPLDVMELSTKVQAHAFLDLANASRILWHGLVFKQIDKLVFAVPLPNAGSILSTWWRSSTSR